MCLCVFFCCFLLLLLLFFFFGGGGRYPDFLTRFNVLLARVFYVTYDYLYTHSLSISISFKASDLSFSVSLIPLSRYLYFVYALDPSLRLSLSPCLSLCLSLSLSLSLLSHEFSQCSIKLKTNNMPAYKLTHSVVEKLTL